MKEIELYTIDLTAERITIGPAAGRIAGGAAAVGLLGLAATAFLGMQDPQGPTRAALSFLVSWAFWLSLVLGAIFFVLIQHLTRAGWSVVVRRMAEAMAANATLMGVLGAALVLLVVGGRVALFPWMDPAHVAHEPVLAKKAAYLNPGFFAIRAVACFAVWTFLGAWFFRQSLRQDSSGDPGLTLRMQRVAAPGVILFALTLTIAAVDFLMSLEPTWFSTIWGVYYFAGSALASFAALALFAWLLQRAGRLASVMTVEHYHDLGKLMFAFTVFWAYIAFSQYMLYWYADIPEETLWFQRRQTGDWTGFSVFLLVGRFLVPFLVLISRVPKRRKTLLALAAVWVLFMHWVDLYYLAMPHLGGLADCGCSGAGHASPGKIPWNLADATAFLGVGGLFVAALVRRLGANSLIPRRDPRLAESLAFENY